jgi:alpha-N-arabinofuranosidase
MINTHWGGVTEDNSFGTHEFMEFCEQVGCEPYICGNVGSGTVQEMSEWVEYMTFGGTSPMAELRERNGRKDPWNLKYFGVGNENWGCGGNMTADYYADLYRRYQTYVRNYPGNKIYKIAGGPNVDDYNWTEVLMKNAHWLMDGLSLHHYTLPNGWFNKGKALSFTVEEYYNTIKSAMYMDELIQKHCLIMDKYDKNKRVGLIVDEWGTWHQVEEGTNPGFLYQQNTMRDAIVAAVSLNIFNRRCERVVMANIAQLINVLQAVILTEGEKMLLTPTYHVFDLYKGHHDAMLIDSFVATKPMGDNDTEIPADLDVSASINSDGVIHVTLVNLSATDSAEILCRVGGGEFSEYGLEAKTVNARILTGDISAHNTFGSPNNVRIQPFDGVKVRIEGYAFEIPPHSVMEITIEVV